MWLCDLDCHLKIYYNLNLRLKVSTAKFHRKDHGKRHCFSMHITSTFCRWKLYAIHDFCTFLISILLYTNLRSIDSKLGYLNSGLPQDKAAPWTHKLVFDKVFHLITVILVQKFGLKLEILVLLIDKTCIGWTSSTHVIRSCSFVYECGGVSEGHFRSYAGTRIWYSIRVFD
jgi:hypothetical protein